MNAKLNSEKLEGEPSSKRGRSHRNSEVILTCNMKCSRLECRVWSRQKSGKIKFTNIYIFFSFKIQKA